MLPVPFEAPVAAAQSDLPMPEAANDPDPEPSNDLPRLYADPAGCIPARSVEGTTKEPAYRVANLTDPGHPIKPARFYDASYRTTLAAIIAHVVTVEGPIFEDVLVRRIARAHGLQRAGHLIREAVLDQVHSFGVCTDEDGRRILWPPGATPTDRYTYRSAEAGIWSHLDTPMPELVGLASTLASNLSESDRIRAMATRLGLSRIKASARARLKRASVLARDATGVVD